MANGSAELTKAADKMMTDEELAELAKPLLEDAVRLLHQRIQERRDSLARNYQPWYDAMMNDLWKGSKHSKAKMDREWAAAVKRQEEGKML